MNSNRLSTLRQQTGPFGVRAAHPDPAGFCQVPHHATGLPGMPDAAFRVWVALDRWAFRGAFPTNAELAQACGWFSPTTGEPAAWKARRALTDLERLGLVRRHTDGSAGYLRRAGLDVVRPADLAGGSAPAPYPPQPGAVGGSAPALCSLIRQDAQDSIDRPPTPGIEPPQEAAPRPARRVCETDVEPKARELHGRLYAGRSPALTAGDWRQWHRSYLGIARDLLRGRLTVDQVDRAIATARHPATRRWGARFLGAIRDLRAGREPRPAPVSTPPPCPAVTPARPAVPDPGPPPPRLPGEPLAAYLARCTALAASQIDPPRVGSARRPSP
jgi:hypothetical protein